MVISSVGPVTRFLSPANLGEALEMLRELGDSATVLAGGTDVMVQLKAGQVHPETLLYIGGLRDLEGTGQSGSMVVVGALATHHSIATDSRLASRLPALAEACSTIGGWQTQEVGTVGGNVCNASPAADTIPPLLVADASVTLASASGERSMPVADFVLGRRSIAARPDELVTRFELTPCAEGTGEVYLKVAPRSAMEVAVVGLAVRLQIAEGTVTDARIAATAVAPKPFRSVAAEQALIGSRLEQDAVREAGRLLSEEAQPIDDARGTAAYRKMVLERLVARGVEIAMNRALGE